MIDILKKFFKFIVLWLKEISSNSVKLPEVTKEDIIKENPELFVGTDWIDWKYIVIHHSLTEDRKVVDWNAIRRYHIEEKRWLDIGYHSGIEQVDGNLKVMVGRPLSRQGAHSAGFNDKGIGVCVIGEFDMKKPSEKKLEMTAVLVKKYMKVFNIPVKNVIGHREVYSLLGWQCRKTCPGLKFDMDKFRKLL